MANDNVIERIAAWQAAGLIGPEVADRLRAAEAAVASSPGVGDGLRTSGVGSFFGPIPSIAELFGYVGAGFVLVAWHTLSLTSGAGANVVEWLLPAVAFGLGGVALASRSERERRAAGVAFAVATAHVFGTAWQALDGGTVNGSLTLTVSAAIAVAAALAFRRVHPALLTQLGLLGAMASFAGTALQWVGDLLFPSLSGPFTDFPPPPDPDAAIRITLQLAWWLAWAVGFGLLGLREASSAAAATGDDPAVATASVGAARRASATRFVAGLTAVGGATSAIMTSQFDALGSYGRVLAPLLGDAIVLGIALVLLALAIRRGAMAYLYPAALGVIVAFSDLNAQYVAERTGIGLALLVEGLILIGAGVLAERLRRRLAAGRTQPAPWPAAPMPT
jgi:hypothetical protein